MAVAQEGGALISLALVFPEEWWPVKRHVWLRYLPYSISIALMLWGLLVLNNQLDPWAYVQPWSFSYYYAALGILIFLGVLLYRQHTNPLAVARQQARIILWGSFIAFTPLAVWFTAPLLGLSISWNPAVFVPLLIFFPLSVSVAILRYRMWDIDVIINRTLVYSLLSVLLGLVYYGSVLVLTELLSAFIPETSELAVVASTLAIVALFNPLRRHVQNFIDSRFFHRRFDVAQTLAALGKTLQDDVDLALLIEHLEVVIWDAIMPAHVLVWIRTRSGFQVHISEKTAFIEEPDLAQGTVSISLQDPVVGYFGKSSAALEIDNLDPDSPGLDWLKFIEVKVVVPLISQGELVGWISLGPRLSDQDYSADDRNLLSNLAIQAAPAVRVAQLVAQQQAEALERERLENEMRVARMIQHALLPKELPDLPCWQIGTYYQPARAVGGDFYDFFYFEDGRVGLFIGDVTDKGVPAAIVMATTRSLLRAIAQQVVSPGEVLRRVNDLLEHDIPSNMFVTCLYAILDPQNGNLQYANAGHNLPYQQTENGVVELFATGMPLGLMPGMDYEEKETFIAPGEYIIFYSDGLVEAHNSSREMFGSRRLQKALGSPIEDSQVLINYLLSELQAFTGSDWEQEDDVTLVGLRRSPTGRC
jgi:serine phosphatase RsbU (regulator of sigma subunit)